MKTISMCFDNGQFLCIGMKPVYFVPSFTRSLAPVDILQMRQATQAPSHQPNHNISRGEYKIFKMSNDAVQYNRKAKDKRYLKICNQIKELSNLREAMLEYKVCTYPNSTHYLIIDKVTNNVILNIIENMGYLVKAERIWWWREFATCSERIGHILKGIKNKLTKLGKR